MKKKLFCILTAVFLAAAGAFAVSIGDLMIVAEDGTFLGTFENEYSSNSVYNQYGTYGSPYAQKSIFNKYGTYGSDYSSYSPFNKYSSNAPRLMDRRGNYYGRLSVNRYASGVTDYSYNLAVRLKTLRDSR